MNRIMKVLSICTIVMLALALMPAGSVLAALNPAGPITSAVAVVTNPVPFNGSATVNAAVDNMAIGSNIVSAEYSLDGGVTWLAMTATGGFGFQTVAVSVTFTASQIGVNKVCVHADDLLGNTGPDACYNFTVTDQTPPVVSNVKVTAVMVGSTGSATVTATIDDSTTGGSIITGADYSLDGGATWVAMTAVNPPFDAVTENVTATITTITAGIYTLCVRGTDFAGNVGKACPSEFAKFVLYAFKGFLPPIRMDDVTNKANAPQTIPIKWWLTDVNGKPVSKATVLSTIKIVSYQVNCTTLVGDPSTASAIGSPGKSGLKFLGNGRWQINWKTEKSFRGTCRKMFIAFNAFQNSPEVVFSFK